MRCLATVILFASVLRLSRMDVISNRYCPDMRPQFYVSIEQLLGMWYGVELINHKQNEERVGIQVVDSCPIIHISEDHSPTVPPYYRSTAHYSYGTGGSTYGSTSYNNYNNHQYDNQNEYATQQYDDEYNRRNDYNRDGYGQQGISYDGQVPHYGNAAHRGSTNYGGRNYGPNDYPRRYADDIKRLRLLWTDNGGQVEYNLRYNVSSPGFWISSGPQNGSSLEPQYNQFAGTIQVIKAVGNHLVLTFCHQLPDQQLYTIILSRIPQLTRNEISDIHDLLTKRALETNNIKRVCSQNGASKSFGLNVLLLFGVGWIQKIYSS